MPRSPDSTTDTYLDVLRTLGVLDAALERHHGAGPETPLRVAIDGDRGSPTADLLSALDATGRLLDLRDGLAPDDGDRLTASLARFGLRVECDAVDDGSPDSDDGDGSSAGDDADDASPDADLELRVIDDVTGETVRITTARDQEAAEATLREELPGADAIRFAELLDGRHLVADPRELHLLAQRYGARLQPYDDPLFVPEDALDLDEQAVELDDRDAAAEAPSTSAESDPASGTSAPDGAPSSPSTSAIASAPSSATPSAPNSATSTAQRSTTASASDAASAADADDSFGDFVSAVDDSAAEAVESALESSGSTTHTIEGDGEDVAAASNATVGGGPKRTVSTSGIDDVFDHLESSATDDDPPSATTQTMSESTDPPTDATASSDDADVTPNGLTGGPTRTVSTTSADDILEQATGERDFEEIAAEEGDADPDAVLADAEDVPPALEDSDVAAPLESGDETGAAAATASVDDADESASGADDAASDADDPTPDADEPAGAADVPPADPAATPEDATDPIAVEPEGEEAAPMDADADADAPGEDSEADGAGEAAETDPATPMPAAAAGGDSERAAVADAAPGAASEAASSDHSDPESSLPDDELLEEDVELRRGSESVDQPVTPEAESLDADPTGSAGVGSSETADADGPLAASGGVDPQRSPDGSADTEDAASTETPQSAAGTGGPSGEPDASTAEGAEIEESAGTEDDLGLVGRITSTIFGR